MRSPSSAFAIAAVSLLSVAVPPPFVSVPRARGTELEEGFRRPPPEARPWVYWFWLDGNMTREGVTADLEAMARVGIGGVLIMEVDQGAPPGPVRFGTPEWRQLFRHVLREARRLGIEVNMNNDAGWTGSGGPWIEPAQAMQRLVFSETAVEGPSAFDAELPRGPSVAGYYRDVATLAFPRASEPARVDGAGAKTFFEPMLVLPAFPAELPQARGGSAIPRSRIVDLSEKLGADGRLRWQVPEGRWTILRVGHTPTGAQNSPSPADGRGLECDKLSREGAEAQFRGFIAKLVEDSPELAGEGKALVATHIDSWEVGTQNWTPRMREEFSRRRGYDLLPFLPAVAWYVVEDAETTERFLWDFRRTISELLLENYAGRFRELARERGMRLTIEAYHTCPVDELAYAGRADEPMGEFWSWSRYGAAFSCTEMASAAHTYGKRIVGAEAFTATDAERWLGHPGNVKDLGDWAFAEGINRFVFHRYAHQPWTNPDRPPGMSMGPWGLHYERTQTWWENSGDWHAYLARCQWILQQGLFVADICLLAPEGAPTTLHGQRAFAKDGRPLERPGHNFDVASSEVVLSRMSVQGGALVLPDGMRYSVLVLPRSERMTPELLAKIRELIAGGATVIGFPPKASPSLSGYPGCDARLREIAAEIWGKDPLPEGRGERRFGEGRVVFGPEFAPRAAQDRGPGLGAAKWIWTAGEGNPAAAVPVGPRCFRKRFLVPEGASVRNALLFITADNSFACWLNGAEVVRGDDFRQVYRADVLGKLRPGENLLCVRAVNGAGAPNPAALVAALYLDSADGRRQAILTDGSWEWHRAPPSDWLAGGGADGWSPASEIGPVGMAPWGDVERPSSDPEVFPEPASVASVLRGLGIPPDFELRPESASSSLRWIHRRIGAADAYFVANATELPVEVVCRFRVTGRQPELWWPESGRVERAAAFAEAAAGTDVLLRLEALESVFVVFREPSKCDPVVRVFRDGAELLGPKGTGEPSRLSLRFDLEGRLLAQAREAGRYRLVAGSGKETALEVGALPEPVEIPGPWEAVFPTRGGGPRTVTFERLASWTESADEGIRHFSGRAVYRTSVRVPEGALRAGRRVELDLGRVEAMAEVLLNGRSLGLLWKPPYRIDATEALRAGENALEVAVVNLWVNRMIGDESLPEDSERNPSGNLKSWPAWLLEGRPSPAARETFTSWRLWKKGDPLLPSGLLGPVRLVFVEERRL